MSNIQAVWLRNDLRLDDHPALIEAQAQGPINVVYVATPKQWQQHHESPARLGLKATALQDIAERLAELFGEFFATFLEGVLRSVQVGERFGLWLLGTLGLVLG